MDRILRLVKIKVLPVKRIRDQIGDITGKGILASMKNIVEYRKTAADIFSTKLDS